MVVACVFTKILFKEPKKKTYNKKRCRHKLISHILWNEIHFSWSPTASDACKMKIAKKALFVLLMATQLSNLWSMQSSFSLRFGAATKNRLVKMDQMLPRNLWVGFKSASIFWRLRFPQMWRVEMNLISPSWKGFVDPEPMNTWMDLS